MKALLLLGMHRSYTSLVARWLFECKINTGDNLLPGGLGNSDGHYEDLDFFNLHRKALIAHGVSDNGMVSRQIPHFDETAFRDLSFTGELRDEADALIAAKCQSGLPFAWKEPRTCLFLKYYREKLDCHSLVLFRPYQEVVGSLMEREPLAARDYVYPGIKRPIWWLRKNTIYKQVEGLKDGFLASWIFYNERLLDHIEATPNDRFFVHNLQTLSHRSEETIDRLKEWGFPAEHVSFRSYVKPLSDREPMEFDAVLMAKAEALMEKLEMLAARA